MRVDSQENKSSQVSMKVKKQTRAMTRAAMMKQRQDAAAKLQALARGRRVRAQQKQHSSAAVKLQALVRGKRDRRAAALKRKKKKRTQKAKRPLIIGRTAYKSYVGSCTQPNTDKGVERGG